MEIKYSEFKNSIGLLLLSCVFASCASVKRGPREGVVVYKDRPYLSQIRMVSQGQLFEVELVPDSSEVRPGVMFEKTPPDQRKKDLAELALKAAARFCNSTEIKYQQPVFPGEMSESVESKPSRVSINFSCP